jgi:3-isopropylmalate dehydrogenase
MAMQMIKDPRQFDVVVTCNMFGDILTDLGAQLQGGLGMAASGNLRPGASSMFEPVHGSAPKYAGKDAANPFGAILTLAMMLETTGVEEAPGMIERAVVACLDAKECTADVGGGLGTAATGDAVAARVRKGSKS